MAMSLNFIDPMGPDRNRRAERVRSPSPSSSDRLVYQEPESGSAGMYLGLAAVLLLIIGGFLLFYR
jgi:hypothetical protein